MVNESNGVFTLKMHFWFKKSINKLSFKEKKFKAETFKSIEIHYFIRKISLLLSLNQNFMWKRLFHKQTDIVFD